jgi:hypothetical protein
MSGNVVKVSLNNARLALEEAPQPKNLEESIYLADKWIDLAQAEAELCPGAKLSDLPA